MNQPHEIDNKRPSVLFWEYAFNQSFSHVESLLDSKCVYLKKLREMLYSEMKDDVAKRIKYLEDEINKMIGLLDMTQKLKMAYLEESSQNASLMIKLSCENKALKIENQEHIRQIALQANLIDVLLERSFSKKEGGVYE